MPIPRSIAVGRQRHKFAQASKIEQSEQTKALCAENTSVGIQEAVHPEELQEILWKQFFASTGLWWDNRQSKPTPRHPDFRHKESKVPLWLNNRHKPVWVDSELATMDARLKTSLVTRYNTAEATGAFAASKGLLDVGMCRKLCEAGVAPNAVDALDALVQRGSIVPSNLFYRVLKDCIKNKDLNSGRRIHVLTVKSGYDGDAFLATHLIGLYASHGRLEEAMGVFAKVTKPDAYNWAAIIFAYARHGEAAEATEAIRLYRQMRSSTAVQPDSCLFSAVLKACATAKDLAAGKEVHSLILASPGELEKPLQARVVNMYAKCGCLEDARKLFDKFLDRDVVTWTAMIAGYAQQGMGQEALRLYSSMQQDGVTPNSVTYVCVLQACANVGVGALHLGKQLHGEVEERGLSEDAFLGGSLVNMYVRCGSLEDARRLFNKLPDSNIVAWNAMIAGYAQQGMGREALNLRSTMRQYGLTPDSVTYVCLLQACASIGIGAFGEGKQLHEEIEQRGLGENAVIGGSLVNMYAKCGSLEVAHRLLEKLPERNIVAWTAAIAGYAQQGMGQVVLSLYKTMQQEGHSPDSITYVHLLQACASVGMGALNEGRHLHAQIEERGLEEDAVLGGSLVNMYVKCGSLEDARRVFDKLPDRNVVAWTVMIAGYAQHRMGQEALGLYRSMQRTGLTPNPVTFLSLLQACAAQGVSCLREGQQLHAQIQEQGFENDPVLGGSLVNMYAKCGSLKDARRIFDKLPHRNVVVWNAMIAGYAQHGMGLEALSLHNTMQQAGITPNPITYKCLLQACAAVGALQEGEQLHAEIEDRGLQADGNVGAAVVNMYAKCGRMCDSRRVFDSLSERSIEAWNALLTGYARNGESDVVFDLLEMMKLEGKEPDEITFLGVLTACSHVGLVAEGWEVFKAMKIDYGITASTEHYICMVDLLGRAGHLQEALSMARKMPFSPNEVVWLTLLGACRKWKNVEIGLQAFKGAVAVDEKNSAAYVLMSNIYESCQMWASAKEMKSKSRRLEAWKKPGQSWWTDMGGVVHTFLVGNSKQSEHEVVHSRLEQLMPKLQREGHMPYLGVVAGYS